MRIAIGVEPQVFPGGENHLPGADRRHHDHPDQHGKLQGHQPLAREILIQHARGVFEAHVVEPRRFSSQKVAQQARADLPVEQVVFELVLVTP